MTGQSRFTGGLLATLALAGAGVASGQSTLFVAAVVPLAFVLFGAVSTPSGGESLRARRAFSAESPLPGDRVRVTLDVENAGETALPDVRVADGVPADLRVVEGTPDAALALPEGGTATIEYTVVADRGRFPFDPGTARVRGTSGGAVQTVDVPVEGATKLDCRVAVADVPLRRQTTPFSGPLPTDSGGPGIEFHSTRDYERGDPASRINWRRYAKTGDLSTVNFRERRAAAVVLAVDARDENDVSARSGSPSGGSLSAYAAAQAVKPLEGSGHQVGLAVFGVDDPVTGGAPPAWVPPGKGDAHHARIARVLDAAVGGFDADDAESGSNDDGTRGVGRDDSAEQAAGDDSTEQPTADGGSSLGTRTGAAAERRDGDDTDAASTDRNPATADERANTSVDARPTANTAASTGAETSADVDASTDTDDRVSRFVARVDPGTQVVVCTPALDSFPVAVSRRLGAEGHRVTAVCPDVTATDTPGRTLAAADRALALSELRALDARVVDWSPDESLASAVSRATTAIQEGQR